MASERTLPSWLARVGLALALGLVAPAVVAQPSASDRETARALMSQGDKAYDAKDYPTALKAYRDAHALMHVPGTGIWVAKAELALGHLVEAREAAIEVTRMPKQAGEPPAFTKARADADELAKSLGARIPSLQVKVEGAPAGAQVTIKLDGGDLPVSVATIPRKVNPGKHAGVASAPGQRDATGEVVVNEGDNATLTLKFGAEPAAATPPSASAPAAPPEAAAPSPAPSSPPPAVASKGGVSPLVPIGFIAGGIGVGAGAVFGVLSLSKTSALKGEPCVKNHTNCHTSQTALDDYNSANTFGWVSNIGVGVGVAGAAVGVIGLVVGGKKAPPTTGSPSVQPFIGLGSAGLAGRF
jgi:hypothetical protein